MHPAKFFRKFDFILLGSTMLLVTLGLLVLYSSSIKAQSLTSEIDATRQILYAAVGFAIMIFLARLDYRIIKNYVVFLYVLMISMLIMVEFFGTTAFGATRWITLGFFQFQPTEFAKLLLIVVLAVYFSRFYDRSKELKIALGSGLLIIPPVVLVLVQPDLGSALVFVFIWLIMLMATKLQKRYFIYGILALAVSLPLIFPRLLPYQQERIKTLVNPTSDPLGTGYNVAQSKIAVGSGGWLGKGLGAGSQSQLNFLPSQHTDFIFAVLAEKLGFFGGIMMLILFAVLFIQIIKTSLRARDRLGSFICIGIVAMFLFHVLINVGMNLGIMPVTGIPLPFLSAGGSSMIVSLAAIGLVQSVASRSRDLKLERNEENI